MNENIDLTKILKDCPKGWRLYSSVYGELIYSGMYISSSASKIYFKDQNCKSLISGSRVTIEYYRDGRIYPCKGECTLFPSKDQRDWSKFIAPWYKKERFDPKTLKPFDRVIVRNHNGEWRCATFSHIKDYDSSYRYDCCYMIYRYCIPYNDGTKHLVGTTDEAPEYYRYWED